MNTWWLLAPMLMPVGAALALLVAEGLPRSWRGSRPADNSIGAVAALAGSAALSIGLWLKGAGSAGPLADAGGFVVVDSMALFMNGLLASGAALAALLGGAYMNEQKMDHGEFQPLLLLTTAGAMLLASAADFQALFVGLEAMSLGAYALTGFRRTSEKSAEGALKYFLLGAFAAALLLYGVALLYGVTGHTDFAGVARGLETGAGGAGAPVALVGALLVLVGLAFKVSAVPFHMWTPDAYQGAPTPVTAFMSVVVKGAAFAALMRVLGVAFAGPLLSSGAAGWPPILAALAVLTMTFGNVVALRQDNLKRMLAYSSIAHAGYLLVGVVAAWKAPEAGRSSVLFYLLAYTVSNVGAFGAIVLFARKGAESVDLEDFAGVGRRHPLAAAALGLFMLSLAGVPPTAGFFAKLYVFRAALDGGLTWLAILGVANSALGAYYYIRVLVFLYMKEPEPGAPTAQIVRSGHVLVALVLTAFLVLYFGLWPSQALAQAVAALG